MSTHFIIVAMLNAITFTCWSFLAIRGAYGILVIAPFQVRVQRVLMGSGACECDTTPDSPYGEESTRRREAEARSGMTCPRCVRVMAASRPRFYSSYEGYSPNATRFDGFVMLFVCTIAAIGALWDTYATYITDHAMPADPPAQRLVPEEELILEDTPRGVP